MRTGEPGREPRPAPQPHDGGGGDKRRSGRQAWPSEDLVQAELARTVMLLDTVAQVERDVASTLRAMASADGDEVAERRLRLAEEAIRGAHAAVERSEHLQQQAHRWKEHAGVVRLHHALHRAGALLADLAHAEKDIAEILTDLASEDGPQLAAQRQDLAKQALAGARHADARAQALRELAAASAARTRPR